MPAFCSLSSPTLQDLFKGFARHLSHLLTEEQNPARKTGEFGSWGERQGSWVLSLLNGSMALKGAGVLSVISKVVLPLLQ